MYVICYHVPQTGQRFLMAPNGGKGFIAIILVCAALGQLQNCHMHVDITLYHDFITMHTVKLHVQHM